MQSLKCSRKGDRERARDQCLPCLTGKQHKLLVLYLDLPKRGEIQQLLYSHRMMNSITGQMMQAPQKVRSQ